MANYPYFQTPTNVNPYLSQSRFLGAEQPSPQVGLKGRPVASIDEVRATSIDFDGSIFYFPDLANKRIYTKQINMDGTSTLNVYEFKPMPAETPSRYVTREEFEAVLLQLQQKLAGTQVQGAPPVAPQKEEQAPAQPQTQPPANFNF